METTPVAGLSRQDYNTTLADQSWDVCATDVDTNLDVDLQLSRYRHIVT